MKSICCVLLSTLVSVVGSVHAASPAAATVYERSGVTGGLVVHLGAADVDFITQLGQPATVTLQVLTTDRRHVTELRQALQTRGVTGKITVEFLDSPTLPYADNLVNLLVVSDASGVSADEMRRVLTPGGTMISLQPTASNLQTYTKPWSDQIDEWTHFMHDASGNAVAADHRVAPVTALQWIVDPKYCRSHEIDSSLPAMVSAGGRLFYFVDEGPIGVTDPRFPNRWKLVARDAFNGVLLWKQPLRDWGWRQWKPEIAEADWRTLRGQRGKFPAEIPRRLVAVGDRVYTTLAFRNAPLSILNAATGELIRECEGTEGTQEIIVDDGVAFLRVQPDNSDPKSRRGNKAIVRLMALDTTTGQTLWDEAVTRINPLTLTAANDAVVFQSGADLVCRDRKNGQLNWQAKGGASGVVVIHKDVVLTTGKGGTHAYSLADGKKLWDGPNLGRDLFVIQDLVWRIQETTGILATRQEHWPTLSRHSGAQLSGYDYRTGELKRTIDVENAMSPGHHLRCYRSKATDRYILYPKRGAEFLDLNGKNHMRHDWLRGSCRFGVLPCNGLLYTPPDQCFCYAGAKMNGLFASSSTPDTPNWDPHSPNRLIQGAAFAQPTGEDADPGDWPAFRSDPKRSGSNKRANVSTEPKQAWNVAVGGKLTQPVIAAGKVFISAIDQHTIHAFDAASGKSLWNFVAGGRIDSSPTYYAGLLLFGANDGRVYCLDADSGQLAWQFQAAPSERRIVAYGQVESPWPVHGTVLILNSLAYVAAGRSTHIDSGAYFYALEPRTGRVVHSCHVKQPQPDLSKDIGDHFAMEGSNIDILTTDGKNVFCTQEMFDAELNHLTTDWVTRYGDRLLGDDHLMATGGILDNTGFNRIFWTYGNRWPGFYFMLLAPKSGNLLVFDKEHTWATKWFVERNIHSGLFFPETTGYLLFCDKNSTRPFLVGDSDAPSPVKWLPDILMKPYHYDGRTISDRYDDYSVEVDKGSGFTRGTMPRWQGYLPVRIEAMALTNKTLFAAGPPDVLKLDDPLAAFEGRAGGVLLAIDPDTGRQLSRAELTSPPTFDGLAAAANRLYFVTQDGHLSAWK